MSKYWNSDKDEPAKASDIEKTVLDVLDPYGAEMRQLQDDKASARMELRRIIAAHMPSVTFRPLSRYDFDVAAAAYDENARLDISHRVRLCRAIESILPHGMPVVGGSVGGHAPDRALEEYATRVEASMQKS